MSEQRSTDERLERLERAVEDIQRTLALLAQAPPATSVGPTPARTAPAQAAAAAPPAAPPAPAPREPRPPRDWWALGYLWVGRAGIALLAVGLAYLFRYAVVRGWLTPPLRVGFGLLVGSTLMALGSRLQLKTGRRAYGLLLMGGGVGILYLSAYAAFAFYGLVTPGVALAALATLTLLAIALAAERHEPLLAQVGAVGAFAAPLLVHSQSPSVVLFAGYIALVTLWAGGVAVRQGWRVLSWTTLIGASVLLVIAAQAPNNNRYGALLVASVLGLLGPGAGALWRERQALAHPDGWPRRSTGPWLKGLDPRRADAIATAVAVLIGAAGFPLYAQGLLTWPSQAAGGFYLGEAVALALIAWTWRRSARELALFTGLLAALPLLAGTLILHLPEFRGLLALEALGFVYLAGRLADARYRRIGEAVFAFVALAYVQFALDKGDLPIALRATLGDLAAVAAGYAARLVASSSTKERLYGAGALGGLLLWLLLTLSHVPGGAYWTTVSWGAVGTALLLAGHVRSSTDVRTAAFATLAIVALKLLLVDTAKLPPGGRIVVFIGFGALFLVLGGLYRRARTSA